MRTKSNYCLSWTLPVFLLGLVGCDNKVEDHQSDTGKIKTEQNRVKGGLAKTEGDKRIDDQNSGSRRPAKMDVADIFSDLKMTAGKFTDTRTRFRFLVTFLGNAVQSEPARVLPGLNQLRDLNPEPDDVGWYNQLVADTVGNIPADRVGKTWEQMGAIGDQKTRRLVAQRLLINFYNSDVFAASKWLDSIPNSDDKHYAVRALVEKLNISGDKESAAAWRDSLPEKYRLFLD